MGQYDTAMKLLIDTHPQAVTQFVLHIWQQQQSERALHPPEEITRVTQLSVEFQSEELDGDTVLLLEGPQGPLYLLQLEFQSRADPLMALRSLEYCIRAKKKHWKTCRDLPIIAAVIYLFPATNMPASPLRWVGPAGETVLLFSFLSIALQTMPREQLLALHQPELWPLVLLTNEPPDRILIEEMFTDLKQRGLYDLLPLGYAAASWRIADEDHEWLHQEYQKMFELFQDAPAFRWMKEDAARLVAEQIRREERALAQEAQAQALQAQAQALQAQAQALREQEKERQDQILREQRQAIIDLVTQRFPDLTRLARVAVRTLTRPEVFCQTVMRLSQAPHAAAAQDALLAISEEEMAREASEISE